MNKEKINEFIDYTTHDYKLVIDYFNKIFGDYEITKYFIVTIANDLLTNKQKNIICFYCNYDILDWCNTLLNKYKLITDNKLIIDMINKSTELFYITTDKIPILPNKLKHKLSIIYIEDDFDKNIDDALLNGFNNVIQENINFMKNNKYHIIIPKKIIDNLLMEDYSF